MEFISNIRVTKYSLRIDGIEICYSKTNEMTILHFDRSTTCAMLVRIGVIQDFIFSGREPVILTIYNRPERYRLELWNEFVLNFIFTLEMAQNIAHEYYRHKSKQNVSVRKYDEDVEM